VTFTIITQTTVGIIRNQGVGLGLNCQETATPERFGSREMTGGMTGGMTGTKTMTSGTEIGTTITDVNNSDLLAVIITEGFSQKVQQMCPRDYSQSALTAFSEKK
jgi:hypothetical protein